MLVANSLVQTGYEPLVLIVEDDLTTEPLWSYMVGEVDPSSRMLWATSEHAAERILRRYRGQISMVIADIFLVGSGNGLDLWQRYSDSGIPFVMMSVMNAEKVAKLIGDHERPPLFLQKPIEPHRCMEVLRYFLGNFP